MIKSFSPLNKFGKIRTKALDYGPSWWDLVTDEKNDRFISMPEESEIRKKKEKNSIPYLTWKHTSRISNSLTKFSSLVTLN
jgi:hypothetical protein